jgi:hypothetical protein
MLVTILARYAGVDTDGGATWYSKAIEWGVVQSVTDGSAPDRFVTRNELATILYRYAGIGADGYGGEALDWAKAQGILNDGRPTDTATRAELVAILQRFIEQ